ncbi:acetylornithine/N-succinyldiaminopimelate aminotransferase [Sphingobium sp. B1D7B]|uniref:aspartate aminotransferase family protein n=1 Tax=Sphingobium TaxID=165695 RepID=UPI0015EBBF2C|nr:MULTISPECIES: aspartate aminotransferase family protein [Sphingobium]MCW2364205.1 acetylornithine/N-succinyldiaminopimelate aminotransferase [Sphingobium sp. B10D3B]MCW2391639.1 acetylornithine/N-succinyldiaminopimelate aminotransferase [Sphingobium sp. B11D3A]MCW2402398.1 acetylornithine/N-succinyldiaminopimelate aminotransferase [Sphingobium sp. B10D7B]MCW2403394.1 acetylornithine/N-succinyldiaminopimelate aminotransferase [Sphingobium sp. B1D7B]MCW2409377.1 acetylornithine/N-succinyldiam
MSITPLMPVYPRCDVRPVRGEGCYLIGERGERYLDFASGIAVNALGHGHPHLVKAIAEQAATLMHVSNLYGSPQGEAFAQRIVENSFADTVFFTNSGAEAVECAIKTARRYHFANGNPQRHKLITFKNAFHGRTLGTISATDQPKMRDGFEPLLPGFDYVAFNDLETALSKIDDETAGFLVETVQGEGGLTAGKPEFIKGLREAADKHGLLLVLDEVQCGYGRTGKFFAHEHYGVKPDVMAVAKGIGGGFPLGACLATEEAAKGMVFGTHGSTYGGNPLAMAAGMAVLDVLLEPGFLEQVAATGERLRGALEQLIPNHDDVFEEVRGLGLMLGVKLKPQVEARNFVAHLRDNHGLLTVSAGENVVRILPPLVIEQSHIDEAIAKLSAGAASIKAEANAS